MKKTTVYLSDEQTMYTKDRAREVGSSEADVIRSAIDQLADAQPIVPKRPRSFGGIPK